MATKRRSKAPPANRDVTLHIETGTRKERPGRAERARAELVDTVQLLKDSLRPDSGHVVRLWRFNPVIHDDEYLGPVALAEFSLDHVAQVYGGGQFGWRVADGDGKYVKVGDGGVQRFNIAGPSRHPDGSAVSGMVPAGQTDTHSLIALLKDLVVEKRTGGAAPDLGAMALQMATAMAGVQAATMTAMRETFNPAGAHQRSPLSEVSETITAVLDLSERLRPAGGDGGGDPLATAAFTALARALEHVADSQRVAGVRPTPRPPVTAGTGAPAPDQPPAEETAVPTDPRAILAPFVANLVKLAQRNRNPTAYVEPVLDQLADYPAVLAGLEAAKTPEERATIERQLAAAFPETAPYPEWFAEWWGELWATLDEPAGPDVSSPSPPRSPSPGDSA